MRASIRTILTVALLGLAILSPTHAAAQTVPFKVYITELWQLDTVDLGLGYIGDYYANVTINGVAQNNHGARSDETSTGIVTPFRLFKNFTRGPQCTPERPGRLPQTSRPGRRCT